MLVVRDSDGTIADFVDSVGLSVNMLAGIIAVGIVLVGGTIAISVSCVCCQCAKEGQNLCGGIPFCRCHKKNCMCEVHVNGCLSFSPLDSAL